MPAPQNHKNHGRIDPPMHLFVFPVLLVNLIVSIYATIHNWPEHPQLGPWWIVVSIALVVLAFKSRINDLKVQDRLIRLEERLRLIALLPPGDRAYADELDIRQLIALRFASDDELPDLVHKTLTQRLEPKAIKQSITHWRPDDHRV
ncbi:MAG: hypothetical protein JWQ42_516 [Edaphobacter sp.]|jgi:hypothetical protein|nr:hypothetical protein [Edaphobacter sp.]MCU1319975.1 hypothetical protein [Edaphobacter sp.]